MPEPENNPPERRCAQCGAELPANLPPELCPKCLLKLALETGPGPGGTVVMAPRDPDRRGLPQPGEQLGHYQIVRRLGSGGMGAVFEADDLENGRRVALKVLSQALDAPAARERFFREGRLAASLNHPNSVYVFGTEEIGGTPVIAMELVPGGTLEDYVRAHGPMSTAEAVDAVLDIIAGLEAAQRVGILHRDVKPSNCFREANGTVKIGDFGLSISTGVRAEPALTASGSFLGTPAFCPPEQLRGEELNARSDMYSVGATLFYLLTGRTPFEGKGVVALIAAVLEQPAPSPRKLRPGIPKGLAKIVLRCLEKQPGERFKNYRELAQALTPYSSMAPTPATLGLRFLAGALDVVLLGVLTMTLLLPFFGNPLSFLNLIYQQPARALAWMLAGFTLSILYYSLLEGIGGATLGKVLCGLRVAGPDRNPPGVAKAALRALIYVVAPVAPYWLVYGSNPRAFFSLSTTSQFLMSFSFYLMLGLLFSTVRRRNGFAALHDLATHTRVLSRAALQARPVLGLREAAPSGVDTAPTIGPYHLLERLEQSAEAEWLLGYDLRLLRKVWVHKVAAGTPPVAPWLRNLGRVGRLRWLAGRRSVEENWDAFEAPAGRPLLHLAREPQPWSRVRFWLFDLARELSAAEKDGTWPAVLGLDRVWITEDGQAKLLDFPAPGLGGTTEGRASNPDTNPAAGLQTAQQFLDRVAAVSLTSQPEAMAKAAEVPTPLPIHARHFLQNLPQYPELAALVGALQPLLNRLAEVTRWRRAALVGGCLVVPLLAAPAMLLGIQLLQELNRSSPGLVELNTLLSVWDSASWFGQGQKHRPADREFAIYIAHHYRATITNASSWSSPMALSLIKGKARRFAEQSVADYPAPTKEELEEADAAVGRVMPKVVPSTAMLPPWMPAAATLGALVIYVGIPALAAALLFRGGLVLLLARVTFVRKDGKRASRLRVFWRALVAWSSLALGGAVFASVLAMLHGRAAVLPAALAGGLVVCALALLSLALPKRGLQDRLAGTWLVPR
jgi:eukaryotic-like serine/threonine-protein kinase